MLIKKMISMVNIGSFMELKYYLFIKNTTYERQIKINYMNSIALIVN